MSTTLIKNGYLITMNEDRDSYSQGDVAIRNDKIVDVGEDLDFEAETVIDAEDKIVMPGLVNTHTHLSMVLLRGYADDMKLQPWLEEKIWPMEANLDASMVYDGARLGCLEMIKSGTTCFADQYFFMDKVAKAVKESGLRSTLSYGIIEENDPEKREEELEAAEELVENYEGAANGRIETMFGPHSTYTCSPECLKEVKKLADKYDVGIHIHLSENSQEVEDVKNKHDKRPPEVLESIDFFGPNVLAAHCTKLNEREARILEENDVKVAHNPVSNMKLASGIAPISDLVSRDMTVGVGTDGASSNNSLDMFEEMKFGALLAKIGMENPTVIPAEKALEMVTIDGAKALGREDEIGSLEAGKKADIILIDLKNAHHTPIYSVESHLVYSSNGSDVDTVIVDGDVLMENRNVKTLEEKEVRDRCQKSSEKLTKKVKTDDV